MAHDDEWEYDDKPEFERERKPKPEPEPTRRAQRLASHRGVLILILGLAGLLLCQILGIVAWVMGNDDLRAMDAGRMDPSGRDLTQAGRICGIIAVVLMAVSLAFILLLLFVGGVSTGP